MDHSKKPEKENPKSRSNPISQLFFTWTIPLLFKGSKKGLSQDDLTKCLEKDSSEILGDRLEDQWYKEINRAQKKGREPKLKNALFRTFWKESFLDGIFYLTFITIKSFVPFILAQLLLQFQLKQTNSSDLAVSTIDDNAFNRTQRSINGYGKASIEDEVKKLYFIWNDVNWLASIVITLTIIACFVWHHVGLREDLLGARMRIACCSLIYRKTLRLSKKTAGNTPAGYLVNLLSNDVNRLDYGFIYVHYIWILPFQSVLIAYLIWQKIGIASLIGVIGLLLKTVPVHTGLSKLSSKFRSKIAYRTDRRVGIMNELVQGIQVIKMYAWEKPFQAVVAEARRKEIKQIRYASFVRGIYLGSMVFTERSTLYITMAGCVLLGAAQVTADLVFSLAQYFNVLQMVSAVFYPLAVSFAAEAFVSIGRIQEYLMKENQDEKSFGITQKNDSNSEYAVKIDKVSASWNGSNVDPRNEKVTLNNLNLQVKRGQLCAIVGPVGAGKSSLLHMLLGEVPIIEGDVMIHGNISYGSQEPWLFTGTVRNNILFGETFNKKRYNEVTRCCALLTDFDQLPEGDRTIVGDRGASLSGGQRARISLARAMYKEASVYLFDDPLSAVDAHVGRHLFDEVLGPKSRLASENVTRFLVTHQVHFLTEADWIVILEDGRISHQGCYKDLANSDIDFAKLMDRKKDDVSQSEDEESDASVMSYEDDDDIPYIDGAKGYSLLKKRSVSSMSSNSKISSDEDFSIHSEDKEALADGQVPPKMWKKYFLAGGSVFKLFLLSVILILSQAVCSGSDYFSNFWTQQEYLRSLEEPTELTTYQCLYIYGILILLVVFMAVLRGHMFFTICMRASKVLHDRMFRSILNATMRFFDTNPSGRILNRFSKDMGTIDEYFPMVLMTFLQVFLVMSGILVLIIIVNPILFVALLVAVFFYILLLRFYLRPSQDLKRLEGVCRSPVFSHLSATLSGLSTIRARGLQDLVIKEFDNLQDVHSGAWHLTKSLNYAFGLWLDIVSCAFLTAVTFSFIFSHDKTFSGSIGLAISQAMILTGMVQHGVRQATESLQSMTSVERVIEYTDLDQESKVEEQPEKIWPSKGKIVFKNMSLRYAEDSAPVLKSLNIRIEAGWKVGIVGRTGAGKSSLIGALFRLSPIEGEIFIDEVETGSIALEDLRSRISIIPQDPVLFSASVRYNLDPFEKYSDQEIWEALGEVELKTSIQGLDYMVTERGSNFSVGQRQLICLARAILRNNKVLVLDEATANVDPQTDALIQITIRRKFKECTVLTVAHRLHTVMDSDKILVMDAGFAKEFDSPHLLLQNSRGLLRQMVDATGAYDAEQLKRIAQETYEGKNLM